MFVDYETDEIYKNRMYVGYRINNTNWQFSPPGKIRVARFTLAFTPCYGYYSEVYLKILFRMLKHKIIHKKWKYKIQQILEQKLSTDITNYIINYL
jgi:hypothetical protein